MKLIFKSFIFCLTTLSAYAQPFKILDKPDYVNNKDGTISDKNTQLTWSKTCDTNNDGKIDTSDKLTLAEAFVYAKNSKLAGFSDWRLPNIRELYSLIDFDGFDLNPTATSTKATPFIDTKFFDFGYGDINAGERLIDAQFATTSIYTATTMYGSKTMFGVNFADGRIKGYGYEQKRNRTKTFYVYIVRGNEDYSKNIFVDNKDGTISDLSTNLMWAKNDSKKGLNWEEANTIANKLNFAGYSDWRMPTAKELQSIVDYTRSPDHTNSAAINPIFNCTEIINEAKKKDYPAFWSSSIHKRENFPTSTDTACYVNFGRSMGYMNNEWLDVHGAGAQRSELKVGNPSLYPQGRGPQGDAIRIYNFLRPVRDILPSDEKAKPIKENTTKESTKTSKKLPNIILFLADDFGFGSLNVNGASQDLLQTPNMNMLASEGINFTNAQTASSVCSPTRYAVLTGIYPWRVKEHQAGAWGYSPQLLEATTFTLQKMLKEKGYTTAMFGKWHLGLGTNTHRVDLRSDITKTGINITGFDYSWAIATNLGDSANVWLENDKIWGLKSLNNVDNGYNSSKQEAYDGYDAPQRVADEVIATVTQKAINWIKSVDGKKPFFLYFANPAIHEPITPSKKNAGKSNIGAYGDYIMDLDDSLGDVIAYLKESGQYDNTLIIFTSDNGGVTPSQAMLERINRQGGQMQMGMRQRAGGQASQKAFMADFISKGFKPNGTLNSGKSSEFEGGSRVPFIVKWGDNFPKGSSSDEVFGLVDIFATIAHIVDFKLDTKRQAIDSQDIYKIWQGEKFDRKNLVTISKTGVRTIRNAGFKYIDGTNREALTGRRLVQKGVTPPQPEALYDLNTDLAETKSILLEAPEKASQLKEILKSLELYISY